MSICQFLSVVQPITGPQCSFRFRRVGKKVGTADGYSENISIRNFPGRSWFKIADWSVIAELVMEFGKKLRRILRHSDKCRLPEGGVILLFCRRHADIIGGKLFRFGWKQAD